MTGARLEVGRVGRAHGLKGDVTVTLTSDRRERLDPGSVLFAGDRELVVATARQTPEEGKRVCLRSESSADVHQEEESRRG